MMGLYDDLIRVDAEALATFVERCAGQQLKTPDWRLPVFPEDDKTFATFITVANALNFAFTDFVTGEKFTVRHAGEDWAGAFGMFAALSRACEEQVDFLDPASLQQLTPDDVAYIFRPTADSPLIPLLDRRAAQLNSVGASLAAYGNVRDVAEAAAFDAGQLLDLIVSRFAAYADDWWLHPTTKKPIVFDKRARLLAVMYEGRARASEDLPRLTGLAAIGPIVDYQIPRLLRAEGVLCYRPDLAALVDDGVLLAPGSIEELAIRSAAGDATEVLLERLRTRRGDAVTMVELDYLLWRTGRNAGGRHHLCATTAY